MFAYGKLGNERMDFRHVGQSENFLSLDDGDAPVMVGCEVEDCRPCRTAYAMPVHARLDDRVMSVISDGTHGLFM
ncbi:hypothetical protein FNV43_RR21889 [Rhamnella rubrinervis]|uniref:Uncharacterized protein n=1 Tax=Rhamnella rubrinervis TaxID=2594499 RepID=A0A8K0GS09_9ROSA|nr:hypothetical protein FNV43_RR21889 [Rhamnella rubrinervis]